MPQPPRRTLDSSRIERYRDVIPDWDRFFEVSHTPEPVTLRCRRALLDRDELADLLARRGFAVEPVAGLADYLRVVRGPGSAADTLEHWMGLLHIQQSVMALPVLALGPLPGERVLDLCAAPGGKTVHLAEEMEDRGPLVAVDPKEKRLRGLMANVFRLGHTNVLVVAADGRTLPGGARFDRVLVDAPCSAEGNYRRQRGRLPAVTEGFRRYVTTLQEDLLRRAVELVRPGGTIVYATCTFAPEENEGVVSRVLGDLPVRVEPIELPLPHAPGLTEWEGERFDPSLANAWRVYPHHMDSGGLFVVRLRRLSGEPDGRGGGRDGGWRSVPPGFPGEDQDAARARIEAAVDLLRSEYEFDAQVLDRLGWMVRKENIWVQTAGDWPLDAWATNGRWRLVSAGLRAFRAARGGNETPSNHFLGRFQRALGARRRRALGRRELQRLLEGGTLPADELPAGPVALLHEGRLLGRGMVGRGGLRHEIPSVQARRLRTILERESGSQAPPRAGPEGADGAP